MWEITPAKKSRAVMQLTITKILIQNALHEK